jgi:hypothetical protein
MVKFEKDTDSYNRRISFMTSLLLHLLLLLLLILAPPFSRKALPPGYEGIMVRFGEYEAGDEDTEQDRKSEAEQENQQTSESPTESKRDQAEIKETVRTEREEVSVAAQPEKSDASKTQKDDFSKLFRQGSSSSSGAQGDPLGSRDSEIIEGITKGQGKVGEGLDKRGVLYEPNFEDSSQKSGIVVVRICVDQFGRVVSARYTQRGSTTTDSELINIAVSNSRRYRFTPSDIPEQCGTVTISFIVR